MALRHKPLLSRVWPLLLLITVQALCAVVFLVDVVSYFQQQGWSALVNPASLPEVAATLGLTLGLGFEAFVLRGLMIQQVRMQHSLNIASGALAEVMTSHFEKWGLTPTEQDVASFTIKGFSIAEIAELRGSADGTIKTHLNAIYRKSGVAGRAQLVSVLVEDLLQAPLLPEERGQAYQRAAAG